MYKKKLKKNCQGHQKLIQKQVQSNLDLVTLNLVTTYDLVNLDLVILNLATTCDLVTILLRPFFNLLHKIIRFSDSFCGDQMCH